MKTFTGMQWLQIDVANNHYSGLDKLTFDKRLEWTKANMDGLEREVFVKEWKTQPQYISAIMALRAAQQGEPTGHLVGVDATASGAQIMSALTGCYSGAEATNLVDPDRRANLYNDLMVQMSVELGKPIADIPKDDVKKAIMTVLYGSEAMPAKLFGKGTPELAAFYRTVVKVLPGATRMLNALRNSWNPTALKHTLKLPDGFTAHMKVMVDCESRVEVDELDHATFQYNWKENCAQERGLSNIANAVHAVDAYVIRSLIRRTNYDEELFKWAEQALEGRLLLATNERTTDPDVKYYIEQFDRSGIADLVIIPHICDDSVNGLSTDHAEKLLELVRCSLTHAPFESMTVHDAVYCHPNNVDKCRMHYRNLLAELADSSLLNDILSQLYGHDCTFEKESSNLGSYIRSSEYALS
jgi:hypothetical protein